MGKDELMLCGYGCDGCRGVRRYGIPGVAVVMLLGLCVFGWAEPKEAEPVVSAAPAEGEAAGPADVDTAKAAAEPPTVPAEPVEAEREAFDREMAEAWGIQILGIRRSAGGYMLDFRYRVLDADKAVPVCERKDKPFLRLIRFYHTFELKSVDMLTYPKVAKRLWKEVKACPRVCYTMVLGFEATIT